MNDWAVELRVPEIGDLVAGRYRIRARLGEGSVGIVYAADHEQRGERVAVKVLRRELARNEAIAARFLDEARAAARIVNEHVARITDVGVAQNGLPFVAMEHLEGTDLQQLLAQQGPLRSREAVSYVLHALEAVACGHAKGIVHGDLKPSNLFLANTKSGERVLKVLDFGIARTAAGLRPPPVPVGTERRLILGMPRYMSPEQLESAVCSDPSADVWAFGVLLYELLTGRPPFDGRTIAEVMTAMQQQEPLSIVQHRPELSLELDRVVRACLKPNLEDRISSVLELTGALQVFTPNGAALALNIRRALVAAPHLRLLPNASSERAPATVEEPRKTSGIARSPRAAAVFRVRKRPATFDAVPVNVAPPAIAHDAPPLASAPVRKRASFASGPLLPVLAGLVVAALAATLVVVASMRSAPKSAPRSHAQSGLAPSPR